MQRTLISRKFLGHSENPLSKWSKFYRSTSTLSSSGPLCAKGVRENPRVWPFARTVDLRRQANEGPEDALAPRKRSDSLILARIALRVFPLTLPRWQSIICIAVAASISGAPFERTTTNYTVKTRRGRHVHRGISAEPTRVSFRAATSRSCDKWH